MRRIGTVALVVGMLLAAAGPGEGAGALVTVGQTAPEVTGGPWINSEPLSLAGLRGRVVLVEFWTFG